MKTPSTLIITTASAILSVAACGDLGSPERTREATPALVAGGGGTLPTEETSTPGAGGGGANAGGASTGGANAGGASTGGTGGAGGASSGEGGGGGRKPCYGHCGYLPNSEDLHPIPDLVGGQSQCGPGHKCQFIGIEECEGLEEGAEVQGWCD